MIVCSCNVFGDSEIRAAFAGPDGPGTVSQVYRQLGHEAHCGRCTRTVLDIMREHAPAAGEGQQ
jgi:bacterioferritin-associated ferredoxin